MEWFTHSSTAASDDAIMALRMEYPNSAAVDCYWAIVEKQYRDERHVPFSETDRETKSVMHRLCIGFDVGSKYIDTMLEVGLLKKDEFGDVYSERADREIEKYQAKCEIARRNGKMGGRKPNAKPTKEPTDKPNMKPTEKPRRSKEKSTGIGSYKKEPIPSIGADAAGAGEPAPPARDGEASCPMCATTLERTGMPDPDWWWCSHCSDFYPQDKADWRAS